MVSTIGFHAHQACEKALKAVLAASAVDIALTRNLRYRLELVNTAVEEIPE